MAEVTGETVFSEQQLRRYTGERGHRIYCVSGDCLRCDRLPKMAARFA